MRIDIIRYTKERIAEWNAFVEKATNATFLLKREYMDYHSNRFCDHSLMFYSNQHLLALLPANIKEDEGILQSHGGLTYGGLIMLPGTKSTEVLEIFSILVDYLHHSPTIKKLQYKAIPYIYNIEPSDEPLYALFRAGATLSSRTISTTIDNSCRGKIGSQRQRGIKKAEKSGIACSPSNRYREFWEVLTETLQSGHNCTPTHTLDEIELLQSRFPNNIKLYTATLDNNIVAGIVVYETEPTAHFQYIAASTIGKETGALDMLANYLIDTVYANKRFIDFGISTEQGGTVLNEGLIKQKEGFGGRAVVYDTYELEV